MTRRLLPALILLFAVGCSGRYPVTGRVAYEDGDPVPAGTVIAEATVDGKPVGVQGNIKPDGTFEMGADKPGDGALPGIYKVAVMPVALGDAELAAGLTPAVGGKYTKYDSSGLKFEVTSGKNEWKITVERPKPKK